MSNILSDDIIVRSDIVSEFRFRGSFFGEYFIDESYISKALEQKDIEMEDLQRALAENNLSDYDDIPPSKSLWPGICSNRIVRTL